MSDALTRLIDATWPAAETEEVGPFTLRRGAGGGKRVSAATCAGPVTEADVTAAEQAMNAHGQQAMFAVRDGQAEFDRMLVERTYLMLDPTQVFRASVEALADLEVPPNLGFAAWPPLQVQTDIWTAGQVGSGRRAVMDRVAGPKTAILGRVADKPAGAAFVALHEAEAVLHALEVRADQRRRGAGRTIAIHAARWGRDHGATHLVALCTKANIAGTALLERLGFTATDAYHYRIRP